MSERSQTPPRPTVGAIRWDAWHGEQGDPGRAVQRSLGQKKYHHRLPFFADIRGDDDVKIDGTPQPIVDREIELAAAAGIDYWAFVMYPEGDPLSLPLQRCLASSKREQIRFCMIVEAGRWKDPKFVDRLIRLMIEPTHQTVVDKRPLLYLGFLSQEQIDKHWGDVEAFRRSIDDFRERVRASGLAHPYIVIMDFDPTKGRQWQQALVADAISSYATSGKFGAATPYAELARHAEAFWDRCFATGASVVPLVMSGWDRRPRIERPVPWETWQQPGVGVERYYEMPTPQELAEHLRRALKYAREHARESDAQTVIVYAWNENDEGGFLVPTIGEGSARLDAIAQLLK